MARRRCGCQGTGRSWRLGRDPTPNLAFTGKYDTYCYHKKDRKKKHPYRCERTQDRMRKQKKADTKPELLIRRALHSRGLRYRIDKAPVPELNRRADLVFVREKVAVFVHGCFWHGCPEHSRATKSNTKWWADKIAANKSATPKPRPHSSRVDGS